MFHNLYGSVGKYINFSIGVTSQQFFAFKFVSGERGGSVVECRTPEQEVGGSKPTAAVLCP